MQFTQATATAILLFTAQVLAAPVAQLHGEGAAADSILTDTDNGVGYGIENAEDNTATLITSTKGSTAVPAVPKTRRQLHGEGAAADSILTDTDNGVGFGIENAEDNTANLITSTKGGAKHRRQLHGEGAAADSILTDTDNGVGFGIENAEDNTANLITSTKGGAKHRRQADKIANGAKAIGSAAGVSSVTDPIGNAGDGIDGSLTDGASNIGADTG